MKTLYAKYDAKAINELPLAQFPGRIITILSEREANKAVDYLLTAPMLGLDTETRPAFRKGQNYKVALMQVSTHDTCFLFRLNRIGMCQAVMRLLENTSVPIVGLALESDFAMLRRRKEFTPSPHIEIQQLVKELGIEDMALQKIWANIFGEKMSKRQRLTNWEADVLTSQQKQYAALDAWACIKLYEEITRLAQTRDFRLIPHTPVDTEKGESVKC